MVTFGVQAVAAVVWGAPAEPLGLITTFLIAAGVMIASAATVRFWPLYHTSGMDRNLAVYWPEPHLVLDPEPEAGPVVIENICTIVQEREQRFLLDLPGIAVLLQVLIEAVHIEIERRGIRVEVRIVEGIVLPFFCAMRSLWTAPSGRRFQGWS